MPQFDQIREHFLADAYQYLLGSDKTVGTAPFVCDQIDTSRSIKVSLQCEKTKGLITPC